MATKWIRFYSPGEDPRPMTVPAPVEWWCSGYSSDGRSVICAIAIHDGDETPWQVIEKYWPGLEVSLDEAVTDDFQPGDRFPRKPPSSSSFDPALLTRAQAEATAVLGRETT